MNFDLGDHDFDIAPATPADRPVDTSGKTRPTQAYLITADGYRVVADIVYDGIDDATGDRRYALVVETDWTGDPAGQTSGLAEQLVACELDQLPPNVQIIFKMPGDFDADRHHQLTEVLRRIDWVIGTQTARYKKLDNEGDLPIVKRIDP